MRKTYKGFLHTDFKLPENGILVFGSNTQGRHGKGVALIAKNFYGAKYGQARGIQGRSYAICTKDLTVRIHPSVSKEEIVSEIRELYNAAHTNKSFEFYIPYSGEGKNLNSYTPEEMARMFALEDMFFEAIPSNIIFEEKFNELVKESCKINTNN